MKNFGDSIQKKKEVAEKKNRKPVKSQLDPYQQRKERIKNYQKK